MDACEIWTIFNQFYNAKYKSRGTGTSSAKKASQLGLVSIGVETCFILDKSSCTAHLSS